MTTEHSRIWEGRCSASLPASESEELFNKTTHALLSRSHIDQSRSRRAAGAPQASYDDLVELFRQFRDFQQPATEVGVPDYSAAAMAEQFEDLRGFQRRLAAIDSSDWLIHEQVDYHLVRAEMNGLEFRHRVLAPWSLDPGFYNDVLPRLGLPLDAAGIETVRERLRAVRGVVEQAKVNLNDFSRIAADLGTLAGVGKENYNWLMKNVYLFPYTWDEIRTIVELEDNRVRTFQRLEENRNRNVPPIDAVQSQAEYKASVAEAIDHLMNFLVEEEIFTVDDYLTPDDYFGSWHGFDNPWPEKHDYFFNFSHREPLMEETHEMVGHHFDGLRSRNDQREIRGGRRPYKIGTARGEGFAFALEELLMHAGYLDGRNPHGREIVYEQAAFRTVRALADIYMHSGDWTTTPTGSRSRMRRTASCSTAATTCGSSSIRRCAASAITCSWSSARSSS